ncbi:SRPBCC domain-containing protein [Dyella amyloliquefaciens]|uniref:SRPBCC domain-containing protein n=1 Tax=Dyella amyloliquefaciens TaxID=1770545 RepID=UPI00102EBC34|nr:SRPBCC domain-containing protein [Dyella amyloliquefaciens]
MTAKECQRHVASRDIRATSETIYRAFLSREAMSTWLPPAGATGLFDVFEPWEGGRFRLTLVFEAARGKSSDNTDVVAGRFVELMPDRRMVMAVDFDSDESAFAGTMIMTWELAALPVGTRVTIVAEHVPAGISQADHETGMRSTLDNLAAFVE